MSAEEKIIAAGRLLDSILLDPRLERDDPIKVAAHDAMNMLTSAVLRMALEAS